jgi:hypothetical protein
MFPFNPESSSCPSCDGRGYERDRDGDKDLCFVCGGEPTREAVPETAMMGESLKQMGFDKLLVSTGGWIDYAGDVLSRLCAHQAELTADDLRSLVGTPPHPNAVGAVFSKAARAGLIRDTGRVVKSARPDAHSRKITVWAVAR